MRFRSHRGGLGESLATTVDVADVKALAEHIRTTLPAWGFGKDVSNLEIEPYGGDDDRIGWKDVHIVTIDGWGVVGFCEGKPR